MRPYLKLLACLTTIAAPWLLATGGTAAADEVFKATSAIQVAGNPLASFDISFVDEVLQVYLLADRSNAGVDIIDTTNNTAGILGAGKFAGVKTSSTSGPNGVVTVNNREAWAGDGDSTVKVIDMFSNTVTHTISTGGTMRADELCWDPRNHIVLISNDEPGDLFSTFISTDTYTILGKIVMDGGSGPGHGPKATNGIEQCKWNPRNGQFYLNLPEVNGSGADTADGNVLVINPVSEHIDAVIDIPVAKCAGPQGMAIGPDHQILLGCHATASAIIDDVGNVIASFPTDFGTDEAWYNPGDNQYFLGNSSFTTPALGVIDAGHSPSADANATSASGSHSVAADPFTGRVFVPVNNAAGAASKICSTASGGKIADSQGCIAVFTATGKDDECLVNGAHVVAVADGDPRFARELCHDRDRDRDRGHDHDR